MLEMQLGNQGGIGARRQHILFHGRHRRRRRLLRDIIWVFKTWAYIPRVKATSPTSIHRSCELTIFITVFHQHYIDTYILHKSILDAQHHHSRTNSSDSYPSKTLTLITSILLKKKKNIIHAFIVRLSKTGGQIKEKKRERDRIDKPFKLIICAFAYME